MNVVKSLPPRSEVPIQDQWDLSSLYSSNADWEKEFARWESTISGYEKFKGHAGDSADILLELLEFDAAIERRGDQLGTYASLKTTEDQANSEYQRMQGRFSAAAMKASEAASYIRPELMAVDPTKIDALLQSPKLQPWRLELDRILRHRPHTRSNGEEQLLAMQSQMSRSAADIFRQLTDADFKWPAIENEKGEQVELGHSSLSAFLHSSSRLVRQRAFTEFYTNFESHRNSLTASLNGSVQRDVYYARARNYKSARVGAVPG